ncbi:MAG: hypothetical protein M9891_04390 [Austwickia sp.]|nr:hypothetical protein [Actinomycetota bacterium]MCB1251736.1 hypothetical protein [Austwickia sp.]MCO5308523.1 hypothetical protein [Austwickia sp.]
MGRTDIPPSYGRFRNGWGVVHLSLLGFALLALIIWAASNGNGARLVSSWWATSMRIQSVVFNLIPFPWG